MWRLFNEKEIKNGVVFIKSKKEFNTVIDTAKHIGIQCKRKDLKVDYWFLDANEETSSTREVMKQFFCEMEEKNIGLIVVRTLKEISDDEIEREAFLETMNNCRVAVYLYDESYFAIANYNEC